MEKHSYSREQMAAIIQGGGSVLIGEKIVSRAEDLPTPAELAQGNAAQESQVRESLDAQIAALMAQKALLTPAALSNPAPQSPPMTHPEPPKNTALPQVRPDILKGK